MMEANNEEFYNILFIEMIDELMSSSSNSTEENDEDDFEYMFDDYHRCANHPIPRVQNFIENVVDLFSDREFKETFR